MVIPNTKVRWSAALAGGVGGRLLFYLNNLLSVVYVSRVVSNSKIYGSLGLVPVFMIGLYAPWLILLFGAQVAYAYQNRTAYFEEKQVETINQRGPRVHRAAADDVRGAALSCKANHRRPGRDCAALAVPTRLVQADHANALRRAARPEAAGTEPAYRRASPGDHTCHDILLAMRATQGQELGTRDEPGVPEVYGEFHRIEEAERQAAASVTMAGPGNGRRGGRR